MTSFCKKNRFFSIIFAILAGLSVFSFSSCELINAPEEGEPETQEINELSVIKISPDFSDSLSKAAYPAFNNTLLASLSYYMKASDVDEIQGTYDSGEITFPLNSLPFTTAKEFEFFVKNSDDNILWYGKSNITYSTIASSVAAAVHFKPYTPPKGFVDLTISTSTGYSVDCQIYKGTTLVSGDASSSTPVKVVPSGIICTITNREATGISYGDYKAKIYIYKSGNTNDLIDYREQIISIWPGVTTDLWYLSDGNTDQNFAIPIEGVKYYVRGDSPTGLYASLSGVSASASNSGKLMNPLDSVQAAIDKCTVSDTKYTIICDGNFYEGFSIGNSSSYSNSEITIIGGGNVSSSFSNFSSAISVYSSKSISLQNIKVSGCNGTTAALNLNSDTSASEFTITNCQLYENQNTGNGGGLNIGSGTTVKLGNGVVISKNQAKFGGGIYNSGTLLICGNALIGCSADSAPEDSLAALTAGGNIATVSGCRAGGIYNNGGSIYFGYKTLTNVDPDFSGGVSGNYSADQGGGIFMNGGSLFMSKGSVSCNKTGTTGAGIRLSGGASMEMENGSISKNIATNNAGGLYVGSSETFIISGGVIEANEAGANGGAIYSNQGTIKLSNTAYIPAGTAHKNIVYLASSSVLTIQNTLTPPDGSNNIVAQITMATYADNTPVLSGSSSLLSGSCSKFKVTKNVSGTTTTYWKINTSGELEEVNPYAVVDDVPCFNLTDTINAIKGASGTITVTLLSSVSADDIGKAETNGTIANAIKDTSATGINLVVDASANIVLNQNCSDMFKDCSSLLTADLRGFNTSNVTNMSQMFRLCTKLTSVNVSTFDTSNVTNMGYMFIGDEKLQTLDVSGFNTSKVTSLEYTFSGCQVLENLDVTGFDTSNVTSMLGTFQYCYKLNSLDVTNFNTQKVTNMCNMFMGIRLASLDLTSFDTSNVTNMGAMFSSCINLETITVASSFVTTKVTSGAMFTGCTQLKGSAGTVYDSSHIDASYAHIDGGTSNPGYFTDGRYAAITQGATTTKYENKTSLLSALETASGEITLTLYGGVPANDIFASSDSIKDTITWNDNISVTLIVDPSANIMLDENCLRAMFGVRHIVSADLRGLNTSAVKTMTQMFSSCSDLEELNLTGWDTSSVRSMEYMFNECTALTTILGINGWNTSSVENMTAMFTHCEVLTNLNIGSWDTSKVTNMLQMFSFCYLINNLDLSGWDTSSVTCMSVMFEYCGALTNLNLSGWDTSQVTDTSFMFAYMSAIEVLDIRDFSYASINDCNSMFRNCTSLTTIITDNEFTLGDVTGDVSSIFYSCTSLVGGAGTDYDETVEDINYAHVDGAFGGPGYFTSPDQL